MSERKLVSVTATQRHIDITEGKTYPVYYRGGVAKFKDDAGDQRTVMNHTGRRSFLTLNYETKREETPALRLGIKVGDLRRAGPEAVTFKPGSIIKLQRDDGSNNPYFTLVSGQCTMGSERAPIGLHKTEPFPDWSKAPSWANYFCIEGEGLTYWLRDYPKPRAGDHGRKQYERGVAPGGREGVTWARTGDPVVPNWGDRLNFFTKPDLCRGTIAHRHTGTQPSVTTSPKEPTVPNTTPQSEAQYIIRIMHCPQNPGLDGSFIRQLLLEERGFVGRASEGNELRFSYDNVLTFLREQQEKDPNRTFEVILDKVQTGYVKPKPKPKGNAGFSVGDKVRCTLSGDSRIHVGEVYEVCFIDRDGDETVRTGQAQAYLKWGDTRRNEYTKVEG